MVAEGEEKRERFERFEEVEMAGLTDELDMKTRGWENQGWHQGSGFSTWLCIAGQGVGGMSDR